MLPGTYRFCLGAAAAAILVAAPAAAQDFGRVISFGDSLSDTGNLFAVLGNERPAPTSPPYFQGRFSNGPVFTELLAGGLNSMQNAGARTIFGFPVDAAANQNYAFGGARTDRFGQGAPGTPPGIPNQIDFFQAQGQRFRADDLVTLYGGANNIFGAFTQINNGTATPAILEPTSVRAADDIADAADRLADLDAPTLVVLNLPDLGRTPQFNRDPLAASFASQATTTFNTALADRINAVAAANTGTNTFLVDVQPLYSAIFADPASFGFTEVSEPCFDREAGTLCAPSVQDQYLYFDTVHPTAAGHRLFAALVTDYLTAGAQAVQAGTLAEVAFADRLSGQDAVRERARRMAMTTGAIAQGADIIEPLASAPFWGGAYVSLEGLAFDRQASGATRGYDYAAGTIRAGADYRFNERFLVGGAVAASQGEVDESTLSYDTQSFSADLYGTALFGPAFLTLSGGIAHFDFDDFERRTAIAPVRNTAGNTNGMAANIGIEAGYGFALGAFTATPNLGLTYAYFDVDGFGEDGAGARIAYGGFERDILYGLANLDLAYEVAVADRRTVLSARLGYEDVLSDGGDSGIISTILGSPSRPSFAAFDGVPGRGFVVGAGAQMDVTERLGLGARYSAGFGDEIDTSHLGSVSLNLRF